MAKSEILGHVDCPHCGESGGMEIKHDKNQEPFGYCGYCAGQMRVGGNLGRVRAFVRRYPWAAKSPVTVTVTEPGPVPVQEKQEKPVPVTAAVMDSAKKATTEKQAVKRSIFSDAVAMLGVK